MITVYGLKNCDTCRKALKWLAAEDIAHAFRDVRADGVTAADVGRWADAVGWETLLNRRGTTWRGLPDGDIADVDAAKALTLMAAHPALIKRPVFQKGDAVVVGFKADQQAAVKAL
ncbi:MAG: arsenate reductase [Rhodospirillaceae bacterium]